jgi:hypothetical protein
MENESLRLLCEQAGKEQDSKRLMELIQEIIRALDAGHVPKPAVVAKDLNGAA